MLLDRGADVNANNQFDITPLHFAARYNPELAAAALLLDRGAHGDAMCTERTQTTAFRHGITPLTLRRGITPSRRLPPCC